MSIEAMKQALEALEVDAYVYNGEKSWKAITSLRQVIAEAEKQEPVFWYRPVGEDGGYEGPIHNCSIEKVRKECGAWKPLYTHPQPKREPLTDSQMMKLLDHYAENPSDYRYNDPLICFARAIEAAHGIKEQT
jgi:hypothetical protein